MVSFFIEAPPQTRKTRLPYIIASLAIIVLHSISYTATAVHLFRLLLRAPDLEIGTLDLASQLIVEYWDKTKSRPMIGLFRDVSAGAGDLVLVSSDLLVSSQKVDSHSFTAAILYGVTALG